ncbi:AAA family ATPase [Vagococcus lutrae]|uniref:AAA family ATPase n=1 Tax=Vagococcus lutrae TaxID=81947 RepID=UPI00200E62F1|nr:SMC family ATPase [Vagococcus lutrae]MDT2801232.1 SMC family ATPase [Vagococcus lutrae]MDT2841379.1 SMC family ATPase [Vagococcus lutrae]UQF70709.1 SMC family ATPase [Vagococcus lutrae]
MKPLRLTMNYFGPHRQADINFTEFVSDDSALFLISGDTGSGKTTIFDAMTYALFGEGTSSREPKEMRSDFATGADETSVRFIFEHHDRYYQVVRYPEQWLDAKNEKRLVKKPTRQTFGELTGFDGEETGTAFTKKNEVDARVSELLGLTADQFRQIILLPQNDFRQFLSAKSDEKGTILRQLFGTEIYDLFTENMKEKRATKAKKMNHLKTQWQTLFEQIEWDEEEQALIDMCRTDDERLLSVKEKLATMLKHNEQLEQQYHKVKEQQDKQRQVVEEAKTLLQKFTELNNDEARLEALLAEKESKAQQRQEVEHLTYLEQYRPLYLERTQVTRDLAEHQKMKETLSEELVSLEKEREVLEADWQELEKCQEERRQWEEEKHSIVLQKLPLAEEQFEKKREQKLLDKKINEITQVIEKYDVNQRHLKEEKEVIQTQLAELTHLEQHVVILESLEWQLDTLKKSEQHWHDLTQQQKAQKHDYDTLLLQQTDLMEQLEVARETYDRQKSRRQDLMIRQLRLELQDGEACLVCGSKEHPYREHEAEEMSEEALKEAFKELEEAEKVCQLLEKRLSSLAAKCERAEKDVARLIEEVSTSEQAYHTAYDALVSKGSAVFEAEWSDKIRSTEYLATVLSDIAKKLSKQKTQYQELTEKVSSRDEEYDALLVKKQEAEAVKQNALADMSAIQTRLKSIADSEPTLESSDVLKEKVEQLTEKIETFDQTQLKLKEQKEVQQTRTVKVESRLAEEKKYVRQLSEQADHLEVKLNDAFKGQMKTKDWDEFIEQLASFSSEVLTNLVAEVARFDTMLTTTEEKVAVLKKEIGEQSRPDLTLLEATLSDLEEETIKADRYWQAGVKDSLQLTQIKEQLETLQEKLGNDEAMARELEELVQVLTGKSEHRLTLERFVLQSYLIEVLEYANAHYFSELTNGRYQFVLNQDVGSYATQTGLEIDVFDFDTNERRSTETLSGGESFIAALSIALSLAEVVQAHSGGVQIEALFVDEGFGSLDQETLEKSMMALEKIGESGRMVGVISHVTEMKARISPQLVIQKLGNGRSRIEKRLL